MRVLARLLPLFLLAAFIGRADSVPPSYIWTGAPVAFNDSGGSGGSTSVAATPDGMAVSGGCVLAAASCLAEFEWYRTFAVTSPGDFIFSASGVADASAFVCDPAQCSPAPFVTASFSSAGSYISLDAYASSDSSGCPACTEATEMLSDAGSSVVSLGLGDYVLLENFEGMVSGSGDVSFNFSGDFYLVPTPEPRISIVLGLCVFGVVFWRARSASAVRCRAGSCPVQ